MHIEDIVIVGAGPGGVAAAVQCQRLGVKPVLIDKLGQAGGLVGHAYSVENYPGIPPTPGPRFVQLLNEHLERFDVDVQKEEVAQIRRQGDYYQLETLNGALHARCIVLAVGTRAKRLNVPGEGHIRYTPSEVSSAKERQVTLVGGGEAALDYALTIAKRGSAVTILCRREHLKAHGRLVRLVEANQRVAIRFGARVNGVYQKHDRFEVRVVFENAKVTEWTDRVVAAIGRESQARNLLMGLDERMHKTVTTQLPGVYLVGDARLGTLGQAGIAVGDGLGAAMAAVTLIREKRDE